MQVQVSPRHKALIVPFTEQLRGLFPHAHEVTLGGNRLLAVKHGEHETYLLRQLGLHAPTPILTHYDWCGGKPFEVQRKTCAMLTMNPRAYVLNGMGTGKTKAALWAWDHLKNNGLTKKLLVVAPLSTLQFTWAREIFNTLPHRKCVVLFGDRAKRLKRLAEDADIYIINHDGVKTIYDDLLKRKDIDALVLDELAVYRNGKANRTKIARGLARSMTWVWGMTGSPMPNEPTDVWAQATIVRPEGVDKRFTHFRDAIMTRLNQFTYVPKRDAIERAYQALQPAVRFTLDDVVELPECIERTIDVDLGADQEKVYKTMVQHAHVMVRNEALTAVNAAAMMVKLLQIACGWVYSQTRGIVGLDNEKRIDALVDNILASDRKVLVFVPFKHALSGISDALNQEGIEHAVVSGDTSAGQRAQIFNLFQNTDKYKVLLAHPQCLAHGITLTVANTIIWYAPVTSLEIYDQANARIRRVGQKHKQQILHLQSTPVEKKIYNMLRKKQNVQNMLLDLFEEASAQLQAA